VVTRIPAQVLVVVLAWVATGKGRQERNGEDRVCIPALAGSLCRTHPLIGYERESVRPARPVLDRRGRTRGASGALVR
jgi:hypothetical protein